MGKWLLIALAKILLLTTVLNAKDNSILISAEEAVKLIGKPNVMFVTGDDADVYSLGHIVGSVEMYAHHLHHADITGHMHCAPLFMCPEEAEKYIGSKGISNDTLVIAYDNYRGPNATGVYAFFKSYGHDKVKILNGGRDAIIKIDPNQPKYDALNEEIKAKKKAKAPKEEIDALTGKLKVIEKTLLVQKGAEKDVTPKKYHIDINKIDHNWIAAKKDVLDAVMDIEKNGKNSQYVIIDSRGTAEIIGDRKLDNVARGGHIPGAKFIEWTNITDEGNKLSFKDLEDIQKTFDAFGITKDKTIYAYCHVGAGRSSHIITALKLLGYEHAKVYTGSWDEWGNDMNLPISR